MLTGDVFWCCRSTSAKQSVLHVTGASNDPIFAICRRRSDVTAKKQHQSPHSISIAAPMVTLAITCDIVHTELRTEQDAPARPSHS
jgi:hypothetical protein